MAVIEKLTDFARRMAGARSAVQELHQAEAALRRDHAALHEERARLISATPERAELLKALDAQVTALGTQWAEANSGRVVSALGGSVEVNAGGKVTGIRAPGLAAEFGGALDLAALCAICPAQVRESFAAIIAGAAYQEGPPLADRPRLIAEIDRKIERVEREHAELVDEAAGARVVLEHMPGERGRCVMAEQRREAAARFNRGNAAAIRRGAVEPMREE